MKIVIIMDGGLIQDVITDQEEAEVLIIDYDIEGADEDDLKSTQSSDGTVDKAWVSNYPSSVSPKDVNRYWRCLD